MALEMVGGAVVGVVFDQLRREIGRVKIIATFKPKLEELEETLHLLYPVIKEIEALNRRLNGTEYVSETIMLKKLLEDGTKLVCKCSRIPRWHFIKQSRQREKLMELDNKIVKFIILMQPHMGRDQKQTLLIAKETKQMLTMSLHQIGYSSNLTMGLTASSTHSSSSYKTMFHIVLQVKLAWELHKIKAMKRLSMSNGIKSIPGEVVRRMREKFTMSATPTRLQHYRTQLGVILSETFSTFTWNPIQDLTQIHPNSPLPQESPRYIAQKERKTDERHTQQRIKKEMPRIRRRQGERKRKNASAISGCQERNGSSTRVNN